MRAGARRSWRVLDENGEPQEVMPNNRLQMDDLQAIADAATAGFGIAWLPCWLVREQLLSGALVRLLRDRPGAAFEAHAVWPHT
ncbi:LysR substrate-binding domain-containing protein, partial [Salmonella enterica]|nr:LysR substrate-binding domain-containing protein [Salmonella enterica]